MSGHSPAMIHSGSISPNQKIRHVENAGSLDSLEYTEDNTMKYKNIQSAQYKKL